MKKRVILPLALLASSAMASELLVGTGVGFAANTDRMVQQGGHVGVVFNAEHHRPLTSETGYFVASNVYVAPAIMAENAPVSGGLVVGGALKNPVMPASFLLGFSVDLSNSIAGDYEVAPGVMLGGLWGLTDDWSLKTSSTFSFPSNKLGVYRSGTVMTSIGLSRSIPVDL